MNPDIVFYYVPLHTSPTGKQYGKVQGDLKVIIDASAKLVRLPLRAEIDEFQQEVVVNVLTETLY